MTGTAARAALAIPRTTPLRCRRAAPPAGRRGTPGELGRSIARPRGAAASSARAYATSPLRLLTPAQSRARGVGLHVELRRRAGRRRPHRARRRRRRGRGGVSVRRRRRRRSTGRRRGTSADDCTRASAPAGCSLLAPDPVVCFARVALPSGAAVRRSRRTPALVLVDWMIVGPPRGRRAVGVRRVRQRADVRLDGRLLLHDALALRAADGDLAARWAGSTCWRSSSRRAARRATRRRRSWSAAIGARRSSARADRCWRRRRRSATAGCAASRDRAGRSVEEVGRRSRLLRLRAGAARRRSVARKW